MAAFTDTIKTSDDSDDFITLDKQWTAIQFAHDVMVYVADKFKLPYKKILYKYFPKDGSAFQLQPKYKVMIDFHINVPIECYKNIIAFLENNPVLSEGITISRFDEVANKWREDLPERDLEEFEFMELISRLALLGVFAVRNSYDSGLILAYNHVKEASIDALKSQKENPYFKIFQKE